MHVLLLFVVLFALLGCKGTGSYTTGDGDHSPITKADITYAQLREGYNANLDQLGTLWCRTDVVIEWREQDEDGNSVDRREKGDGKLMYRSPQDTALLVEKLGQIYLWAGSDEQCYWLFDVVDSEKKVGYRGTYAKLGQPGTRRFPLPVRADLVPQLIGLVPLPESGSAVELYAGQYLIDLPGKRMLIDPKTFRPTRVDLTNKAGYSVLTAKLEGRFIVEVPNVPNARRPKICERAEVYVAGYSSKLTVAMDYATANPGKVNDQMFDFDKLKKGLKVERVISLDAESE